MGAALSLSRGVAVACGRITGFIRIVFGWPISRIEITIGDDTTAGILCERRMERRLRGLTTMAFTGWNVHSDTACIEQSSTSVQVPLVILLRVLVLLIVQLLLLPASMEVAMMS